MVMPDQNITGLWDGVKSFATRSKTALNHPAGELIQENNMAPALTLNRQLLDSALTRAVSVTRRAMRRGAPMTEQLDNSRELAQGLYSKKCSGTLDSGAL